jgi:Fe-S-cluster containining protein
MNATIARDDVPGISCASCEACCCRLEVLLMGDDDVAVGLTAQDRWGGWVMRRLDDGWCAALDRNTLLCTIYERRPGVCRDFEVGASGCIEERLQLVVRPVNGRKEPVTR